MRPLLALGCCVSVVVALAMLIGTVALWFRWALG